MRRLSGDLSKIKHAGVVPFEIDERHYGIGYTTVDGAQGAELVGTKAEAESVLAA